MKTYLLLLIAYLLCQTSSGQDKRSYYINEFSLGGTRSLLFTSPSQTSAAGDLYGYGVGLYHESALKEYMRFIHGIEYNTTSQYEFGLYSGRFETANLTFHISTLSYSLMWEFLAGNKVKFLFDIGPFIDFNIYGRRKGVVNGYTPASPTYQYYSYNIDEKTDLVNLNIGSQFGYGIRIPVKSTELILKTIVKFGLIPVYSYDYRYSIYNRYFLLSAGFKPW